jgi:hypothetical protein
MRYQWRGYLTIVVSHIGQVQPLPLWFWLERVIFFQATSVFGSDIARVILERDFPVVRSRNKMGRGQALDVDEV